MTASDFSESAVAWILSGFIFLAFGPLYGCAMAGTPLVVNLNPGPRTEPKAAIESCTVQVDSVVDERLRKNNIGLVGPRVVSTGDVMPWLQQAFEPLTDSSAQTSSLISETSPRHLVILNASLKKLYVQTLQSSISANVLVAVSYSVNNGPLVTRFYRGTETSVNWTGSADSVSDLLDDALAGVIKDIMTDLASLCRAQKLS